MTHETQRRIEEENSKRAELALTSVHYDDWTFKEGCLFGYNLANEWVKVSEMLPEKESEHFGESGYVECMDDTDIPFIGWYNHNTKAWHCAHYLSSGTPNVKYWRHRPFPAPPSE